MVDLFRFYEPSLGPRLGMAAGDDVFDLTSAVGSLTAWLQTTAGDVDGAIRRTVQTAQAAAPICHISSISAIPLTGRRYFLAPVENQEVWAAGVTYARSRAARQEEAQDGGDIYARVYQAERPELFFKSYGEKVVGPGENAGIRSDAAWSVPEPELAVVLNPALEVVGFTIGNDLSSRDIEGANPLYLPQAKTYTASCALGPQIALSARKDWPQAAIGLQIERQGQVIFAGKTHTNQIQRSLNDLVEYLGRSSRFPNGVILLTGTGIIPPAEFSLQAGDAVSIEIEGIGVLRNPIVRV